MSRIIQRFPLDYILQLQQIGLVFFEKIATDPSLAGETQDFYQGLLVGLDHAVKLIDEEDGVRSLKVLQAQIATFINTENDSCDLLLHSESAQSECNPRLGRLPSSYITQLKQTGAKADLNTNLEICVCPHETEDFYHGCIAALDFAASLVAEKYAYAQISLLKTNAAYFIDLNKAQERQVFVPHLKDMLSLNRKDLASQQDLIKNWVKPDSEKSLAAQVEQPDEESKDSQTIEQEDNKTEPSTFDALNTSDYLLNWLDSQVDSNDACKDDPANFPDQVEPSLSNWEEKQRQEIETLFVDILLQSYQKLKQVQFNIIEDWTAFLEDGEGIRVIARASDRVVLRVSLDGEIQSGLSYNDAEKFRANIQGNSQESERLSPTGLGLSNKLDDDLTPDSVFSTGSMDIEQVKLAESILPVAQKAFDYLSKHFPAQVEETDEYTQVKLGNFYDLIVTESESVSVSSLIAAGRGELIRVRAEALIVAQGILSEDVEIWSRIAQQLNAIPENGNTLSQDSVEIEQSNDIEI